MEIDPDVLRRYWLNECSETEKRQVATWLKAGVSRKDYPAGDDLDEKDLEKELWSSISQSASFPERRAPTWFFKRKLIAGSIAATLILMALLGCLILWKNREDREIPLAQYKKVSVPFGKKMTVALSDSTVIYLNSGSVLKYPERFSGTRRHILLEGEAFFEVSTDPDRPFIAETAHSTTRVLGTRFNLKDFDEEGNTRITVEEGKVEFTGKGGADTLILLARDQALLAHAILRKKSNVEVATYTGWRKNILHFDDIPLAEVIPVIERWYDVKISLGNPALSKLRIRGSFDDPPLGKLLEDFSFLMNLNYRIEQRNVLLYK